MHPDYHRLDRAVDEMLACASVCKAVHRAVGMVTGAEQARTGKTTRGLFA